MKQMLADVESLNRLNAELDGVGALTRQKAFHCFTLSDATGATAERTIHEKSQSVSALSQDHSTMSERNRATLLKLCDLHPEFLSVSAIRSRVEQVAARTGISSQKRLAVWSIRLK